MFISCRCIHQLSDEWTRICWPFNADQPFNAAHLVNIDVAYELFEIRDGESGLKPIYRTGKAPEGTVEALRREASEVLEKAFGDDGARKRAKMEQLKSAVMQAWTESGASKVALESFLDSLQAY